MRRSHKSQQAANEARANIPADLKAEMDALYKEGSDKIIFGKPVSEEYKARAKALNAELRKLGMESICIVEK